MSMTMPGSLELKGMCAVCALGEKCELLNGIEMPVKDCEQFDPDPTLVREMVGLALVSRAGWTPYSDLEKHMGLCRNCEHREGCTFPRNEGGVWYCEEYA